MKKENPWDKKRDVIWKIWKIIKESDDVKSEASDKTEFNYLQSREAEEIRKLLKN